MNLKAHRLWALTLLALFISVVPSSAYAYDAGAHVASSSSTGTTAPDVAAPTGESTLSRGKADVYDGRGGAPGTFTTAARVFFAAKAGGAANAANGLRLGQQLARESAESAFTKSGALQAEVIQNSSRIIPGSNIGNPSVVKGLTADGSNIADWGKYTSQTFQSPSGPFQVHYYFNPATGRVNYNHDYKVVFNGAR